MPPRRKSRLRSAGRVEEKDLLEAARAHFDDGALVQARCVGRHFFCPVQRLNRILARVHARREDESYLQKRSKRGRGLAKAYAGTLLLAEVEKTPYVAQAKYPFGTYPYVARGTAGPHHYVALQHWDDLRARILGWKDFVKKRRFRFFAVGDGVVCAHRRGPVPQAYIAEAHARLGLVEREAGTWTCPHPEARPALALAWRRAEQPAVARVCAACAEGNTAHRLLEHAAVKSAALELDAQVDLPPVEGAPAATSAEDSAERYLEGALDDAQLFAAAAEARRTALAATPPPFFVAGERATRDAETFVGWLSPTPAERRALQAALQDAPRAVVLDKPSAARALEAVWAERGRAALEAAAEGPEGAALHEPGAGADRIADLVRRAADAGRARRADASLPRYVRLPGPAAVADAAARAWRREGREAALRAVADAEPGPARAVALAVLRRFDAAGAQAWKYTREETELADVLAPHVRALLDGPDAGYPDELEALARAAGVVEPLVRG